MNEKVLELLKKVKYPGFEKDIVSFGFVKDMQINESQIFVKVEIVSASKDIAKEVENGVKNALIGEFAEVRVEILQPKMPDEKSNSQSGKNIAPQIKNFVMVSSGKGGVGKSTTTLNLAISLAKEGKKVGVLDADIYGPNIPRMLGSVNERPEVLGQKIKPIENCGIEMISMGSLMEEGQSLIWRGAMIMKVIEQLLRDVLWGELDVLFIDMPPGTGDAQLTLAQSVPVTCGVCVSTPQVVALDDTKRSLDMFEKLHIPIAGIVENMSGFICPDNGKEYDIFGKGTTEELAKQYNTQVLAQIPIELNIREAGDMGKPISFFEPNSESSKRYQKGAIELWSFIQEVNDEGGVSNEKIQPTSTSPSCSS